MQTREELYELLDYDPADPQVWLAAHSNRIDRQPRTGPRGDA
jgi:hypothetical protein